MSRGGSLYLKLHAEAGYQVLTIADDGPGISPEQLGRIFEPFFTTKTRGTGLGLAIIKQIVEQHRGSITAWSESGAGARFTIRLPD
jgi:signal transduction histidine kinase